MAAGRNFDFEIVHNFWAVWANRFKFFTMEALVCKNPPQWPDIGHHENQRWPPAAILDFEKAITFEPSEPRLS